MALVSDAGTPLISDPGYVVLRAAWRAGFRVRPVPGACALTAALAAAGLPCRRVLFGGFLGRSGARQELRQLLQVPQATVALYEAATRLVCLGGGGGGAGRRGARWSCWRRRLGSRGSWPCAVGAPERWPRPLETALKLGFRSWELLGTGLAWCLSGETALFRVVR